MSKIILALGMKRSGSTLQHNLIKNALGGETHLLGTVNEPDLSEKIRELVREKRDVGANTPHLIKSHFVNLETAIEFKEDLAVFSTYRDLRDIFLSFKEKVNLSINVFIEQTEKEIEFNNALERCVPVVKQKYEELYTDSMGGLLALSKHLGVEMSVSEATRIVGETSVGSAIERSGDFTFGDRCNRLTNDLIKRLPTGLRSTAMKVAWLKKIRYRVFNPNIEDPDTLLHINHISRFKGVPGSWRIGLTEAESRILTSHFSEWLKSHSYEV